MSESRYPSMDIMDAHKQCSRRDSFCFETCPRCEMKVGLHCDQCKIQVTGCFCTEEDRFGSSEAIKRLIDRIGFDSAKEKLQKAGFWVPPGAEN